MSNLTNDQKTGELARATAVSLLKAAESVIVTGVNSDLSAAPVI